MKHGIDSCLKVLLILILFSFISSCKKGEVGAPDMELIRNVIMKFDKALIETYGRLNTGPLEGLASAKEISKNNALLLNFVAKKIYMESELKEIKFIEFKKVSKDSADVWVHEKWRWRHIETGTNKVVKPWVAEEYKIVYHMVKDKKKGWIVDSLKLE